MSVQNDHKRPLEIPETALPPTCKQKKNYGWDFQARVPITALPPELLSYLFTFLTEVNHYLSVLRVCGFWNQLADSESPWIRFKTHFQRLAIFYPHLSLSARKAELESGRYLKAVMRGDKCRERFTKQPTKHSWPGGMLYPQLPPNLDLTTDHILCWEGGNLKILDLDSNVMTVLNLQEYLTEEDQDLHQMLVDGITQKEYSKATWIENRYLILKIGPPQEDFFLILDTQKSTVMLVRPPEEVLPDHVPMIATRKILSSMWFWKPNGFLQMAFCSTHNYLSENVVMANVYNFYQFDFVSEECILLQTRCCVSQNVPPKLHVSEKHMILEHAHLPGTIQDVTLFSCHPAITLSPDRDELKRTFVGQLDEWFYFLAYTKPQLEGEVLPNCIYRCALTEKGQVIKEKISLQGPFRASFDSNLMAMRLFYPHFLVTLSRIEQTHFTRLAVWNLMNQECFLAIGGGDPYTIKQFTLLGDFLIFAGSRGEEATKLYGITLKSKDAPQQIPMSSLKGTQFAFCLYRENLLLQDTEGFTRLDFSQKTSPPKGSEAEELPG